MGLCLKTPSQSSQGEMTKADNNVGYSLLSRLKDYHQRPAECRQTIGGGHDAHHLLPDGLRPVCTTGTITYLRTCLILYRCRGMTTLS